MSLAGVPSQFPSHSDARIVAASSAIDTLMERASVALEATDYFAAQEFCLRAIEKARRVQDFERIARITMPLQEARRQVRHLATDARDAGNVFVVNTLPALDTKIEAGFYLLEPPLIGLDGRAFREVARGRKVPILALVKEPTTSAGRWPMVGVGVGEFENVVARVQVEPPASLKHWKEKSLKNAPRELLPDSAWFMSVQEALGDVAIRKVNPLWPAAHRIDDFIELLDAVPDHEKLSQALMFTAKDAMTAPQPKMPRRRPLVDNPLTF
ncbi:hypothetical protein LBMAG48_02570 [Phycisphaerae bacterium]|jgi:hypothetical protein|nr:hypothetical protein LBMAG48_02570 [Phycisphaerae bacterium]